MIWILNKLGEDIIKTIFCGCPIHLTPLVMFSFFWKVSIYMSSDYLLLKKIGKWLKINQIRLLLAQDWPMHIYVVMHTHTHSIKTDSYSQRYRGNATALSWSLIYGKGESYSVNSTYNEHFTLLISHVLSHILINYAMPRYRRIWIHLIFTLYKK